MKIWNTERNVLVHRVLCHDNFAGSACTEYFAASLLSYYYRRFPSLSLLPLLLVRHGMTFVLSSLHFEHSHSSDVIHSQVKRSNYDSAAAEHCEKLKAEQDKCHSEITELHVKWGEIEKQRVQVVAAKANIDNMPDIVEDRRQIEQARAHLDTLESRLNDKKALRESCYNTKIIEIIHLFFVPMPQHWLNKS